MKYLMTILLFLATLSSIAQTKTPQDFGFRHIELKYKTDKVDILVKSKKGDEEKPKPIFFFCQGSLPQPLIKYDEQGAYGVFPFNPDSLSSRYHLVIVSKPFIPLICDVRTLGNNFTYTDSSGQFPQKYLERNLLNYYVDRNLQIIRYLQKQAWVTKKPLILAGHSEGSTIVAKMAGTLPSVTHLIYSGGNPMGRIMSIIQQSRATETDSTQMGEQELAYWQTVVENKNKTSGVLGDSYKTMYEFSYPPIEYLKKLKIPVLVCYGTKDWSSPFNDYLRVEMTRMGKKNFTFNAYLGVEHNYFPLNLENKPNYEIYNWDKVANDWFSWLNYHP